MWTIAKWPHSSPQGNSTNPGFTVKKLEVSLYITSTIKIIFIYSFSHPHVKQSRISSSDWISSWQNKERGKVISKHFRNIHTNQISISRWRCGATAPPPTWWPATALPRWRPSSVGWASATCSRWPITAAHQVTWPQCPPLIGAGDPGAGDVRPGHGRLLPASRPQPQRTQLVQEEALTLQLISRYICSTDGHEIEQCIAMIHICLYNRLADTVSNC